MLARVAQLPFISVAAWYTAQGVPCVRGPTIEPPAASLVLAPTPSHAVKGSPDVAGPIFEQPKASP